MPSTALVTFIGGGNMARSLIAGLIAAGTAAAQIEVIEPVDALRDALAADFGVITATSVETARLDGATWVLAVKPQVMADVCQALSARLPDGQRVLSIAAGLTSARLQDWLGKSARIIRAMPNTPALLGAGMTGLFAGSGVTATDREAAEVIARAAGQVRWIEDEALMDAVTAVSGSGPAYVFALAEAMESAGVAQGLPAETARQLVVQTVLGAARMLAESGRSAEELRRAVTSPNGTTQAALETLAKGDFNDLVSAAIAAATQRGRELSGNS